MLTKSHLMSMLTLAHRQDNSHIGIETDILDQPFQEYMHLNGFQTVVVKVMDK